MIKGLYRSASGMLPQIKKQEAVANNIANSGTAG
ncbi:MAG: flagellar basal-body rod protein FlgF, partial [bacterium]|nr:flagellar basal-body rod protein FlgF [bacterium]